MLTGQNGIIKRANEAKEKTEVANKEEQRELAQAEALTNAKKTTYKGITIPEGFAPTKIKGEDSIDDGLVITDGYGNEYVWVVVPKTTTVYPTAGLDIVDFSDEEYTNIETDLHTYTKDYRNDTTYSDSFCDESNDPYEVNKSDWFQNEEEWDKAKRKMLKSVYLNEGFWIGRYEAGVENNRLSPENEVTIPLSKKNLYPYTYVTRTQANVLAKQVESGSYTSSLMYGVQWDLVLKYIENKYLEKDSKSDIKNNLNANSTAIGNYYNSEFVISRGKFAQYGDLSNWFDYNKDERKDLVTGGKKVSQGLSQNSVLLTTGGTEVAKLQNIYDIAGNVWEWTLEKTFSADNHCTARGGHFHSEGTNRPASYRADDNASQSNYNVGFRVSIY